MDNSTYLEFAVLELSKLLMYETYYDKTQQIFGKKNLQMQYMDTESFVLIFHTKYNNKDLKNLEDLFDISN